MDDQKTCRICQRTRPVTFFVKQSRKYYKPYCKPCHKVYQSWYRTIDREENRSLTIEEFRNEVLPVLIKEGQAPWADENTPVQPAPAIEDDPNVSLSEEEGLARQEEIYQTLLRTMPSRRED